MKKYLRAFSYIVIGLAFLSGCKNYKGNTTNEKDKNIISENESSKNIDTTNWKPTELDNINNLDNVTMTIDKETVSPSKLTVIFKNTTTKQCIYGDDFSLEKKINGKWYEVPVVISGNYGFNSIGYNLAAGETAEFEVDWKWLYGSLNKGEYRIVKSILDFRKTGDYDNYILAAEFSIN